MRYTVFSFVCLVLAGCSLLGLDGPEGRIVFGESIDGVHIGDSRKEVVQKLGEPDNILLGDFPGKGFIYKEGKHAGMSVTIYTEKGVKAVGIGSPYTGRTSDGIGIGSNREEVHQLVGPPDETHDNITGAVEMVDTYHYDDTFFVVSYIENKIVEIMMGTKTF